MNTRIIISVLSFVIGILGALFIILLLADRERMNYAYKLALEHAKDLYKRFPNDFEEAIDTLIKEQK